MTKTRISRAEVDLRRMISRIESTIINTQNWTESERHKVTAVCYYNYIYNHTLLLLLLINKITTEISFFFF